MACRLQCRLCSAPRLSLAITCTHSLYIFVRETETCYVPRADDTVGWRQNASHLAAAVSLTKYSCSITGITKGSSASLSLNSVEPCFCEHSILFLISMSVCLASSPISCLSPGHIDWSSGLCFLNLALCGRPVLQGRKAGSSSVPYSCSVISPQRPGTQLPVEAARAPGCVEADGWGNGSPAASRERLP